MGLSLIIVGLVVVFGGFTYAAYNMSSVGEADRFDKIFKNHASAMAVMGIGGMFLALGILSCLVKYLM